MFGELSSLVSICFRNQSEEEASAVRTVTGDLQNYTSSLPGYQYDMGITPYPHKTKTDTLQDSERRQLSKKINEIVKASTLTQHGEPIGSTSGLNRCNRWTIEKAAAGSYPVGGDVIPSGNVANTQTVARRLAHNVSLIHFIYHA